MRYRQHGFKMGVRGIQKEEDGRNRRLHEGSSLLSGQVRLRKVGLEYSAADLTGAGLQQDDGFLLHARYARNMRLREELLLLLNGPGSFDSHVSCPDLC